jgi:hypothetical protein
MKHTPQLAIDLQHLYNFGKLGIANANYISVHFSHILETVKLTTEQLELVKRSETILLCATESALAARKTVINIYNLISAPNDLANALHIKCAQDSLNEVLHLDILIESLEENIDQLIEFSQIPREGNNDKLVIYLALDALPKAKAWPAAMQKIKQIPSRLDALKNIDATDFEGIHKLITE